MARHSCDCIYVFTALYKLTLIENWVYVIVISVIIEPCFVSSNILEYAVNVNYGKL